ncbi:hypothetical protein L1049_024458 [Liquidambar formosana]|uniref:FAS1 domain-containing protein n=1 Tax=Liquidambar formosana TaxID=63359 RepID=A0AAP0RVU7_LIQFO
MASTHVSLILLALTPLLFLLSAQTLAQSSSGPAPSPSGPINLTAILDKNGQYTTFIRLLTSTQVASQIENQLNNSNDGMTVLAPTDNAFNNLKAGTLNGLTVQQQVELVLYHVLPKYYNLASFETVSNPVRTQASGQDGGVFGLNFTSLNNQVNVSSGLVQTPINNPLRQQFPLAVYEVDKVLLPNELFGAKPPASSPTPAATSSTTTVGQPAPSQKNDSSSSGGRNVGLGLAVGVGLICIGVLS